MTMVNSYAPVLISGTAMRTLFIASCVAYDSQSKLFVVFFLHIFSITLDNAKIFYLRIFYSKIICFQKFNEIYTYTLYT